MTTVAQMIEWMKTLPQDAEVECGVEVQTAYSAYMTHKPVSIDASEVFDFTGEHKSDRYPWMAGRVIVHICGE